MNDIEEDIGRALRAHASAIEPRPDPDDLTRRVRRRRQRRHRALASGALAVALAVASGVFVVTRPHSSGPATAPNPVVLDDCSLLTHLPFRPGYLPGGSHADLFLGGNNVAVWPLIGGGIIEVHRGDVPQPERAHTITVLGRPAVIGSISDGYSVVFNLGANDAVCSEWALVAHSITSVTVLEQVATALVPNP